MGVYGKYTSRFLPLTNVAHSSGRACCYNMAESLTGIEMDCLERDKEREGKTKEGKGEIKKTYHKLLHILTSKEFSLKITSRRLLVCSMLFVRAFWLI